MPILKYDANHDTLVERKNGTLMEEEEPKTQETKMMNLVHHAANSRSNRGMGRKGVHHHMFVTTSTNTNETIS